MPKHGDIKETDSGMYKWVQPEPLEPGYWSMIEDEKITQYRTPMACPVCDHLLDNWKAQYYYRWGVCNNCYFEFLYLNPPELKSNKERELYCKQKMAEKKEIK